MKLSCLLNPNKWRDELKHYQTEYLLFLFFHELNTNSTYPYLAVPSPSSGATTSGETFG